MKRILGVAMALLSVCIIALVFGATYLLVIEPSRINKPAIEKPFMPDNAAELAQQLQVVITTSHLSYLINEMEGYKLKASPLSKEPAVIEFYLTDTKTYFSTTITNNIPGTTAGKSPNADVRISGTQSTIIAVLKKENIIEGIQQELDAGTIQTELLKDAKALGFKGYLAIYDLFS